jgi:hypothetical protein
MSLPVKVIRAGNGESIIHLATCKGKSKIEKRWGRDPEGMGDHFPESFENLEKCILFLFRDFIAPQPVNNTYTVSELIEYELNDNHLCLCVCKAYKLKK